MPRETSLSAWSLSCGYTVSLPLGVPASRCFQNLPEFIRGKKKKVILRIFELQINLKKKILNIVITDLTVGWIPRDAGDGRRP